MSDKWEHGRDWKAYSRGGVKEQTREILEEEIGLGDEKDLERARIEDTKSTPERPIDKRPENK